MKKVYMKPAMRAVKLRHRQNLLVPMLQLLIKLEQKNLKTRFVAELQKLKNSSN